MQVRLESRRYRLPFRRAVRTAHGLWPEREGVLVRLTDAEGRTGWGEATPIPWFGTETVDEAAAALTELGEWGTAERFAVVPARLGCVRHALSAAQRNLGGGLPAFTANAIGVASLLPAGRAALELIAPRVDAGFRVFKWKVGVENVADELALLDDVCAALPTGAKLRLDANGAWDRRRAERWLERCADRPVEFVEQPIAPDARGAEDMLLGLAHEYPTELALDESVAGERDLERWLGAGWPGVFVLKPLLLADPSTALVGLARARAKVVFSSALETAVGAREVLQHAFAWGGESNDRGGVRHRALGLGVWPLFQDYRFDGPVAAPFVRAEDVARINPEAVWNALN
jgi:O-succinylbenzoate synthase